MRLPKIARVLAAAAVCAAPAAASAQAPVLFELCDQPGRFCSSLEVTRLSATSLQVDLRNTGVSSNLNSFVSQFGLFGLGGLTGTLTSATFNGVTPAVNLLAANSGGNNDPFAVDGAGNDLQSGAGTQPLALGADFSNDGFIPCGFAESLSGGARRLATCAGEFGRFVFTLDGELSPEQFSNVGVAVRAQGLGVDGNGSDKCFSIGDEDCLANATVIPEPSTYALMGFGVLGLAGVARHRRATA